MGALCMVYPTFAENIIAVPRLSAKCLAWRPTYHTTYSCTQQVYNTDRCKGSIAEFFHLLVSVERRGLLKSTACRKRCV